MKGIRLQDVVILLQDLDADDRPKFLSKVKQSLPQLNQIDDGYTQVKELRLIAANLT